MIIGIFTELLSAGGVQRAGRHTAAVLAGFALERDLPYRFLSLNDPRGLHQIVVGEQQYSVSGFHRAKLRFVLAALRAGDRHPTLVLAGHPHLAPVGWAVKARAPGVRLMVLSHGIEVWTPMSRLRRWALRRADLVLAPSADTARQLADQQGISPDKVRHLPWGLDPLFAVGLAAPLAGNTANHLPAGFPQGRVVLTVGRWAVTERYKGADSLIATIPRLLPAVPDLYLVVVGDGDDRGRLERLAQEAGVAARVRFLSGLAQKELLACYARCDVFALPSRGEGFGLVFLEAMAHGKPVIGGAHGGAPEIIEDGVTGRLVPHGNLELLTQALAALLTDEVLRRKMGLRARDRVRSTYLFEHFSARLAHILESLCAS